jgi:hypothetical protein
MSSSMSVALGSQRLATPSGPVVLDVVTREGERYLRMAAPDRLPPFFMNVVSDGDGWLFASSQGALAAGRVHPDRALFPYQTVDKILARPDSAGPLSVFLVEQRGSWRRWEPWQASGSAYRLERVLLKHVVGTELIFEETNLDLGLRFSCAISSCASFGLVRSCCLEALGERPVRVRYLDGWHQLIAPGITTYHTNNFSFLALAYLRHDLQPGSQLGIFTLNAAISDRPYAAESLRAAAAWSLGHRRPTVLLSTQQLEAFRNGQRVQTEREVRGDYGAYLVADEVRVSARRPHAWLTVADTWLDHAALVELDARLRAPARLWREVKSAVMANTENVRQRMAAADGLQASADELACVHHFANVLYNGMRGGVFIDGYRFPTADFMTFLGQRNRALARRHRARFAREPETMDLARLRQLAVASQDVNLQRLAGEYLPLTFSRRHGDPSRPWNRFAIHVRDEGGRPIYNYQGNWRDIFQNWEGLSLSYPGWLESMITAFLNASTADGYNPYRIGRDGIDWEVEDPQDAWSHIGYWGDHQIIYLLRLLEGLEKFEPGRLGERWRVAAYASAQIPYRIKPLASLLKNPRETITFDDEQHRTLLARAEREGGDGRLLHDAKGNLHLVTLAEKLLVPVLVKLTNLVPEGGIWLNTQRPEWNDANNALAGWGLSVVTVAHLRRYVDFLAGVARRAGDEPVPLTAPTAQLLAEVTTELARLRKAPRRGWNPRQRYQALLALGRAGERHRRAVYDGRFEKRVDVPASKLADFAEVARAVVDATLLANRRSDGLFHSYNVLHVKEEQAHLEYLSPMLEGQVAVLGSTLLTPTEAADVLGVLRRSDLYRADQHSYLLYPDRVLPTFLTRNTLPGHALRKVPLLAELVRAGDRTLMVRDRKGALHFQADLRNASDLRERLEALALDTRWSAAAKRDGEAVLDLWEESFHHRAFTGRSTTFFMFEGLGSVYWHMISKLLLAVQENYQAARDQGSRPAARRLARAYYDIQSGLGYRKTPAQYGAFPTDPYSHTPRGRGAQQPGMTGQVKEELFTRWGELGVQVVQGRLGFGPTLLRAGEFSATPMHFRYYDVGGRARNWKLPAHSLAFTVCQVPVCYTCAPAQRTIVHYRDGTQKVVTTGLLDAEDSRSIFARNGAIQRVMVQVADASRLAGQI